MKKQIAVGLIALGLLGGVAPGAEAAPVLQGSISSGGGPNGTDCAEPGCTAFFAANCPTPMTHDDGITESIVDVSGVAGQRLKFTWSDTTTRLYDEGLPSYQTVITFYVATSCTQPSAFSTNTFSLDSYPGNRSHTYTLPQDAKWLVVVTANGSTDATWEAAKAA